MQTSPHPKRMKATLVQAAGSYSNTGISILNALLLIPMYINYLGTELYGYWLATGGVLGMLALTNFGVGSLLVQRIAQAYGRLQYRDAAAYFTGGLLVYAGVCLIYLGLGWIMSLLLPDILRVRDEWAMMLQDCFRLALVGMALGILNESFRCLASALLRPLFTQIVLVLSRLCGLLVTIMSLVYGLGLWAIPVGIIFSEVLIFVLSLYDVMRLVRSLGGWAWVTRRMVKEYLYTSPSLFMARLGSTASRESEPLLITIFIGPAAATAYMVTRKAADMIFQLTSVLSGSAHAAISHLSGEGKLERLATLAASFFGVVIVLSGLSYALYIGLAHNFILHWVQGDVLADQSLIVLIGIAFFALSLRGTIYNFLLGLGDFIQPSLMVLMEGVTHLILLITLLNVLGVIGAPIAMGLPLIIMVIVLGVRLTRKLDVRLTPAASARTVAAVLVAFIFSATSSRVMPVTESWGSFAIEGVVLFFLLVSLYAVIDWRGIERGADILRVKR